MSIPLKVLIVEDSEDDIILLLRELKKGGYEPIFERVDTLSDMESALDRKVWDIVISDYSMPQFSGLSALKLLKDRGLDIPFIIVSGAIGEDIAVEAMKMGAHDYLIKGKLSRLVPAIKRELVEAKIRAEHKWADEALKRSVENLRRTLNETVYALATTAEKRDPYTAGHQRRVSQLAFAIAKELGLSENQAEGVRIAGMLHDIGKICIPAEILSKPGKLNDIEMALLKTHPEAGYDILKTIPFEWPIATIVLQHQERLNGTGYPLGISNGEILLEAKIISVADVVEAMASHRPYRASLGVNKALEEIISNKGIFYDPDIVSACLNVVSKNGFEFR